MKRSLLAVIAVAAVTVPTILLVGKNSEYIEQDQSISKVTRSFTTPKWPGKVIPQLSFVISDIKKKYGEVKCLKNYFTKIEWKGAKKQIPDNVDEFSSSSQSCLLVEYYKQTYTDNKWWGEFRLIWSLKDDNQGLITVINARTERGKIWGGSVAYTLKKDNSKNLWKVLYSQEIVEHRKNSNGMSRLIPKKSNSLPSSSNITDYWGFDAVADKICNTEDCSETKGIALHNSYSWEFKQEEKNNIVHSWSSNFQDWLNRIFGWKMLINKMQSVKGVWKEKDWSKDQ